MIGSTLRFLLAFALALVVAVSALWGTLALWYQIHVADALRTGLIAIFVGLALLAVAGLFWRGRRRLVFGYCAAFAALLIWWTTITPKLDGDWSPEVARAVTGTVEGDALTLKGVRNFQWRTTTDFTPAWEDRRYDLSKIATADIYVVYWAGPVIAHTIMSFGFDDGRHIAFSIEIRKEKSVDYSSIAGFFKRYELIFIAADERDLMGLRKAFDEDVRLYRLRLDPASARRFLIEYVDQANDLAANPRFYNTLTTNCTTTIFQMARALRATLPLDWRIVLNGYLPSYLYRVNAVDTSIPLDELIARAKVSDRIEAGLDEVAFGERLRQGVPSPR